jgi:crotonobetainyl-CoA:carnitine CoA-transferase CaiB-like acyl-CoA transferase
LFVAGLLKDVKVIECAQLGITPVVGRFLADEGADVIKLESPFRGDYMRDFLGQVSPHKTGHSPIFLTINRNKRSVAVDLRSPEGKQVFRKMLESADVLFDGYAVGAMERLGLGYEQVAAVKPDIIYASLSAFGGTGPYAKAPAHGGSMSAVAALVAVENEPDGTPEWELSPLTEGGGGRAPVEMAFAIAAALYRRSQTGQGAYIDVGVSDSYVAMTQQAVFRTFNEISEDESGESGMLHSATGPRSRSTKYTCYETKDAKYVLIALIEQHLYENFCRGVGRQDLMNETNYDTKTIDIDWGPVSLRGELQSIFKTKTQAEWARFAVEHDTVIAPVNTILDLPDDPQLRSREAIVHYDHPTAGRLTDVGNPVKVAGEHFSVYHPAPALGEDTVPYLKSLGYSPEQIDSLAASGVIKGS